MLNELLPKGYGYVNATLDKKKTGAVISDCYKRFGQHQTVLLLDALKELGYNFRREAQIR